jgi:hypothetical protein
LTESEAAAREDIGRLRASYPWLEDCHRCQLFLLLIALLLAKLSKLLALLLLFLAFLALLSLLAHLSELLALLLAGLLTGLRPLLPDCDALTHHLLQWRAHDHHDALAILRATFDDVRTINDLHLLDVLEAGLLQSLLQALYALPPDLALTDLRLLLLLAPLALTELLLRLLLLSPLARLTELLLRLLLPLTALAEALLGLLAKLLTDLPGLLAGLPIIGCLPRLLLLGLGASSGEHQKPNCCCRQAAAYD